MIHKAVSIAPLIFYFSVYLVFQSRASARAEASMTAGQAFRQRWPLILGGLVFWVAALVEWFHYMHQHGAYPSF